MKLNHFKISYYFTIINIIKNKDIQYRLLYTHFHIYNVWLRTKNLTLIIIHEYLINFAKCIVLIHVFVIVKDPVAKGPSEYCDPNNPRNVALTNTSFDSQVIPIATTHYFMDQSQIAGKIMCSTKRKS